MVAQNENFDSGMRIVGLAQRNVLSIRGTKAEIDDLLQINLTTLMQSECSTWIQQATFRNLITRDK